MSYPEWVSTMPIDEAGIVAWHAEGRRQGYTNGAEEEPDDTPSPVVKLSAQAPRVRAESNLTFRTAREMAADLPPTVEWPAPPYVAFGAATEVGGKIKSAGKTTWVMALCRAVLDGAPFMGQATIRTGVVYLTEQPPASLREALRRADLLERDDFTLLTWRETIGTSWPDVVAAAVVECRARGARLLVVDTLGQFAGIRGDGENSAGQAQEALEPLQAAAADGLAVVVVRHERKGGGDVGESTRGSTAFGGGVDILLSIRRAEGNSRPTIRVIHALSRFDETPDTLLVELVEGQYIALGDETEVALMEARANVVELLGPAPGRTADELREHLPGTTRTTLQRALDLALGSGQAMRVGKGVRGDPYRYATSSDDAFLSAPIGGDLWAESIPLGDDGPPIHSAHTSLSNGAESDLVAQAIEIFGDAEVVP